MTTFCPFFARIRIALEGGLVYRNSRKRLFRTREAAEYLGVSQWTIRNLAWTKRLPVVRNSRLLLFDVQDLDMFVQQHKQSDHSPLW